MKIASTQENIIKLHQDIKRFSEIVRPLSNERIARDRIKHTLKTFLKNVCPGAHLSLFGSSYYDLFLPSSDMDFTIKLPASKTPRSRSFTSAKPRGYRAHRSDSPSLLTYSLKKLGEDLRKNATQLRICRITVIDRASTPIIRYVDEASGIQVDLGFQHEQAVQTRAVVHRFTRQFRPCYATLVMLLKFLLKIRGLMDVRRGFMGSYALNLLVACFFRWKFGGAVGSARARESQSHSSTASHMFDSAQRGGGGKDLNLGVLLLEFLEFCVRSVDFDRVTILITDAEFRFISNANANGYVIRKPQQQEQQMWNRKRTHSHMHTGCTLSILDPADAANVVGKRLFKFDQVLRLFEYFLAKLSRNLCPKLKSYSDLNPANRKRARLDSGDDAILSEFEEEQEAAGSGTRHFHILHLLFGETDAIDLDLPRRKAMFASCATKSRNF